MTSVLLTVFGILLLIAVVALKGKGSDKDVRAEGAKSNNKPPGSPPAQSLPINEDWVDQIIQKDRMIMNLQMEITRKDLCEIRPLEGRLMEANHQIEWLKKENEELKRKVTKYEKEGSE